METLESEDNLSCTPPEISEAATRQARLPSTGLDFGPPPPLPSNGHIPAVKNISKIPNRTMDPPQCVQNAMMTKDKKPFTYTPGGIDLSEVRSPRMQRRIERNANLGGVSEVPRPAPPQNFGPLPPSALAAMRPQTQVQVFPGPPPPPPSQKSMPPPPPPPMGPLPTQKVTTSENQVLDRPDMTKIIPENPMALLRKTGGPAPRKSIVEQMFAEQNANPPSPPQRNFEEQSSRYQPPVAERGAPVSPPVQQQRPTSYQPLNQQYQTPQPYQQQYQSSPAQYQPPEPQYQPVQVQQRSTESPRPQSYQPPIIERQPTIPRQSGPSKTVNSNVGSLYIPPLNQQQNNKVVSPATSSEMQAQVQSPGTPTLKEAPKPWQIKSASQQQEIPPWAKKDEPEEIIQSAQPTSSGPNPQQRWQPVQQSQQPARPAQVQQPAQQVRASPGQQQFSPRSPPTQPQCQRSPPNQNQAANSFPVHIEIRAAPYSPQEPTAEDRNPNAVYITQPLVLQHPGPGVAPPYQGQQQKVAQQSRIVQQQPKVDSQGARIIPIQIEGRTTPSNPANDRNLSRQLSWGTTPTQSNTFKVIQKITQTEDDEDEDTPITQHSARYTQEMPEQVRRMKVNDSDRFRQDIRMYDEENPRYRGGYIPSKVFKFLEESAPQQNYGGKGNVGMPVHVEGNGQPQKYVHPSEQVVPEPKKYMGSNIPSRSFKILQAMTAPSDSCANANYNEELPPYSHIYNPYNYPYYPPPPYWHEYYPSFYTQDQSELIKSNDSNSKNGRTTPQPTASTVVPPSPSFWGCVPSNAYVRSQSTPPKSDTKPRPQTPKPFSEYQIQNTPQAQFWGYMPSNLYERSQSPPPKAPVNPRSQTPKSFMDYQGQNIQEQVQYSQYPMYPPYPPYFDPYYYGYHYGYPQMMPSYPYYPSSTETEEFSGYSSTDEMTSYNRRSSLTRRNSLENSSNSVHALRQQFEVRSKSAAPRVNTAQSFTEQKFPFNVPPDNELDSGESNTEVEEEEEEEEAEKHEPTGSELCKLRSIKSVHNINVYADEEESETDTSESEETSEEEQDESISLAHEEDEIIPHQLSVIYEESERTESRALRPYSVASESTTLAELRSDDEDIDDFLSSQNVKFKINVFEECSEKVTVASVAGRTVRTFEEENESFAKFSIKSASLTPRVRSPLIIVEEEIDACDNDNQCTVEELVIKEKECGESSSDNESTKADSDISIVVSNKSNSEQNMEFKTVNEDDKESDEDWWGLIGTNEEPKNIVKEEISIKEDKNECDKDNIKAESVINQETDIVCVKLRRKDVNRHKEIDSSTRIFSSTSTDDFFAAASAFNNESVYDKLKDKDEDYEEIQSSGQLMRVGSFVSKLEEIKRNSGLWNIDLDFTKPIEENMDEERCENYRETMNNDAETEINNIEDVEVKQAASVEEYCDQDEESEEIDFWSQIKNDDDDFSSKRTSQFIDFEEETTENIVTHEARDNINQSENIASKIEEAYKETDSTSSRDSSCSKSQEIECIQNEDEIYKSTCLKIKEEDNCYIEEFNNENRQEVYEEVESRSDLSEDEADQEDETIELKDKVDCNNGQDRVREKSVEPQTIKERIEALRNCISHKQNTLKEKKDIGILVQNKMTAIEVPTESRSKTTSTKSSIKSFEEYSEEEEGDSGVISDISRHISDNEEFPELRKLTRYERAATHSRLFKLLQDECDLDDEEQEEEKPKKEDKFCRLSVRQNRDGKNKLSPSRSNLSLPLNKCNENQDSEMAQPVNEKLVDELVQSVLKRKKGQPFKSMPKEKLYAAAVKILQEDIDSGETPSEEFSSLLSPLRGDTESSTPAQTPQEFYGDFNEYKQYYDSWSEATKDSSEILPSKAFKLLQEHLGASKLGTIEGFLAKCPRVLSAKNLPKEIMKLLDENIIDISSPSSHSPPQSNEVTNT